MDGAKTPINDVMLAAALKRARLKRGLSQEALAHASGITTNSYARIELGQANPSWTTVRQIADGLDISLRDLAGAVERAER